jgi:hypothetical protein
MDGKMYFVLIENVIQQIYIYIYRERERERDEEEPL